MQYDLIVIGGGPAGYTACERAGKAGLSTLCIEERKLGGVCLNEGCIPTKTLLYSAKLFDGAVRGTKYGVTAEGVVIDHAKVVQRKDKVVRTLVAGVNAALREAGTTLVNARGVVVGRGADGFLVSAGGETYEGTRLLLAAGSHAAVPPIPGLKEALTDGFAVTSREMLNLTKSPSRLVVIGGGVIGLEFASYFASIGTDVTVIEMLDHIAGESDPDLTGILQKNYEKRGVHFLLSARVKAVDTGRVLYEKDGEEAFVEADKVLLSIGRRASADGLGLESIGVALARGAVLTDEHMRTNVPGVYAAGDVTGRIMLAHVAYRQAEVAVNDMLGIADEMRYSAIPSVVYTNPEMASVGETERSAENKGLSVRSVTLPMRFSGRYLAENEGGDGVMKLVVDRETGVVLGAQALSNHASEFIMAAGVFIEQRMRAEDVQRLVFPHPTACEILREAAFRV